MIPKITRTGVGDTSTLGYVHAVHEQIGAGGAFAINERAGGLFLLYFTDHRLNFVTNQKSSPFFIMIGVNVKRSCDFKKRKLRIRRDSLESTLQIEVQRDRFTRGSDCLLECKFFIEINCTVF